jgi:hypothetical protein
MLAAKVILAEEKFSLNKAIAGRARRISPRPPG